MKKQRRPWANPKNVLSVTDAVKALDHWAHEHNITVAARTIDPDVRRTVSEQPGFWEHVARPGAASRKGSAEREKRTSSQAHALIATVRSRALLLASVGRYWTAKGELKHREVLRQVADELAEARVSVGIATSLIAYAEEVRARSREAVEDGEHSDPKRNLLRAFNNWLRPLRVTWPTREEILTTGNAASDPVALYRHTVAQRAARAKTGPRPSEHGEPVK